MALQAKQMKENKWQQGRKAWHYDPAMQFYWGLVMTTLHDALQAKDGKPSVEALLRNWFATSEMPAKGAPRETISFPECCLWLGVEVEFERVAFLAIIDSAGDFDTEEAWTRLEWLSEQEPASTDSLFDPAEFRIVPELDHAGFCRTNLWRNGNPSRGT